MAAYKTISAQEFAALDFSKYTLVDLREPVDLLFGRIEGAINVPVKQLEDSLERIPKDRPVVAFCYIGLSSEKAAQTLAEHGYDVAHVAGGYNAYRNLLSGAKKDEDEEEDEDEDEFELEFLPDPEPEAAGGNAAEEARDAPPKAAAGAEPEPLCLDAKGLKCPGPIVTVADFLKDKPDGTRVRVEATEDAFCSDIRVWCERTGNSLDSISVSDGVIRAEITRRRSAKAPAAPQAETAPPAPPQAERSGKTFVVFSGDLDKTIAAFIMANGAAAMGRKVTMFFTFWGLNILRRPEKVSVRKSFIEKMFGLMMPRGTKKLGLSRMNMGGAGAKMIRRIMKEKGVSSLEDLIESAKAHGVRIVACQMSMDIMGIHKEELIDGVELGGVATFLGAGEESDMSLFI